MDWSWDRSYFSGVMLLLLLLAKLALVAELLSVSVGRKVPCSS